jgi:hypothetical protein
MNRENDKVDGNDMIMKFIDLLNFGRKLRCGNLKGGDGTESVDEKKNEDNIMKRVNLFSSLLKNNVISCAEIQLSLKIIDKLCLLLVKEDNLKFGNCIDLLFIFVSSIIISHKYMNDIHLGNEYFSSLFGLCPFSLSESIFFSLSKLNYNLVL